MRRLAADMRSWRAVYRVTQDRAAGELGVSTKTWQRWEREETDPHPGHVYWLAALIAGPPPWWSRD